MFLSAWLCRVRSVLFDRVRADGRSSAACKRRRQRLFSSVPSESLEERLLLSGDGLTDLGLFVVPGSPDEQVTLNFELSDRNGAFRSELGLFIADDDSGAVDGVDPDRNKYAREALQDDSHTLLFDRFDAIGETESLTVPGGSHVAFYLIQNSDSRRFLRNNPQNRLNRSPKTFFSVTEANPDHFDHLRSEDLGSGTWQFGWEDLTFGGDRDFDDVVVTLTVGDLPGPTILTPPSPTGVVSATFTLDERMAAYRSEFGIFKVDDETGRIGNLTPDDRGYARAALTSASQLTIFERNAAVGSQVTVELEADAHYGVYLIQNSSLSYWLRRNPQNRLCNFPKAFFGFVDANPDNFDHTRWDENTIFWEDLTRGGDRDFDDLVISFEFGTSTNQPPALNAVADQTVDEDSTASVQLTASDPDSDPADLMFSLVSGPATATVNQTTGLFEWTPLEADGPGTFPVTVRVEDETGLFDELTFSVIVNEVNQPPVLAPIGNRTVDEEQTLTFTASATDSDLPPNTLTFSLTNAPAGASIDPQTGEFSWMPSESDGPGTFDVTVNVHDGVGGSDSETITISVNEVNQAPVLDPVDDRTVPENGVVAILIPATDNDLPANTLTWSLIGTVPAGVNIDGATGQFNWTPSEAQGPGSYPITVQVDDGAGGSDQVAFTITVEEVNEAPVLDPIGNRTADVDVELTFTATASDPDIPPNALTFSLDAGAPAGATIDPVTGVFRWTPTTAFSGQDVPVTVRVTDDGNPSLDDFETIIIAVDRCVFDDNLTGWTVTESGGSATGRGGVVAQDCTAVLTEGDSFFVQIQTTFDIVTTDSQLLLSFSGLTFDTTDPAFVNDAFELALLDQNGVSLVSTTAPGRDVFFNVTEELSPETAAGVTFDGATVTVNLSAVPIGSTATLVARLVNNDSDTTTSVTLTDMQITPGAAPLLVAPEPSGGSSQQGSAPQSGANSSGTAAVPPGIVTGLSAGTRNPAVSTPSNGTASSNGIAFTDSPLQAGAAGVQSPTFDSRGTEFWIGFMDNLLESGNVPKKQLFVTGDVATTGFVEIPGLIDPSTSVPFRADFVVNPGEVTTVDLPSLDSREDSFDTQTDFDVEAELIAEIQALGVHVVTQDDVTVYGLNRAVNTTDAFLALPVDALGTEYINLGYNNGSRLISSTPNTEFLVVATEDDTVVTIVPGEGSFSVESNLAAIVRPSGTSGLGYTRNNGTDIGTLLLDQSGTHTITVDALLEGYAGTYTFELLDFATAATPINFGETVTTTLPTGREARVFSFGATTGQRIYYDAISPGGPTTTVRLVSPSGVITALNTNNDFPNPLQTTTTLAPETGTYYVLVVGEGDAAYDFSFRMLDLETAPLLPFGTEVTGTMPLGRETDVFRYNGTAGQRIIYDGFDPNGSLVTLDLWDPGITLLSRTNAFADLDPRTLPEDGEYFVTLASGTFGPQASYGFRMFDVADLPVLPLGTSVTGTFGDGRAEFFRLPAGPAQAAAFSNITVTGRIQIDVFDPSNRRVATFSNGAFDARLAQEGDYVVRLRGVGILDSGTFDFQVDLTDDALVAKSGLNTETTLTINAGETATYDFTAPAGTPVILDARDTVNENLRVRIFDPDGVLVVGGVFGLNELTDSGPFFLEKSGTYTLSVVGDTASAAGSYTFQILDLQSGSTPISFDTIVSGTLPTGREAVAFSFDGTANQLVAYDGIAPGTTTIATYDENLNRVDGVFGSLAERDGGNNLIRTGKHYVVLQGVQNTAADFAFRIQDVSAAPVISLGEVISGTITPARTEQHFQIDLTAGQRLLVDGLDDDTERVLLQITDPGRFTFYSGTADQNGDSSTTFLLTVPRTARYVVSVQGDTTIDPADFSFRILDLDNAPLLTFDTDIDITLNPGRQAQFFRIDADTAASIDFDNITETGIGGFFWHLFDPAGRNLGGDNNGRDFTGRTWIEGTYLLGIVGRVNTPIDFTFRATRTPDTPVTPTGFNSLETITVPINGRGTYTFDSPAGRLVYLNVVDSQFRIPEHTVTLDAGETYLIRDQLNNFGAVADLTGTIITGDKPFALFGGSRAAFVPTNFFAADHLVEQMTPTSTWGRRFVTFPLATGTTVGDRYRFLAQADGTEVFVDGTLVATLNRGQFHEMVLVDAAEVTSNNPILVAQYAQSQEFYRNQPGGDPNFLGDPFMMLVPPFEQFLANYTVATPAEDAIPEGERFDRNFLNIVAPADAVGLIEVNGTPVDASDYTAIGTSGFFGVQVPIDLGSYEVAGPQPFGLFVYGFGSFDSYGYVGGQSLSEVATVSAVTLVPETVSLPINTLQDFTATVTDSDGNSVEGVRVDFSVAGANPQTGFAFTDSAGVAVFTYTGTIEGRDVVSASVGTIVDDSIVDWLGDVAPPTITILSPAAGTTVPAGTTLVVTGIAAADRPFASLDYVSVNGIPVESFDAAGNFFTRVFVGPGDNVFQFAAHDSRDQTATVTLILTGEQIPDGEVDFSQFSDVTGSFDVAYAQTSFNAATQTLFADIAVRNTGQFSADVPLLVGITNITDPRVLVRNIDGTTPDGIPFYDFTGLVMSGSLDPNSETGFLSAEFFNPNGTQFDYDLVFFGRLNEAPAIVSLPTTTAIVDRTFAYDADATDANNDALTFSLLQAPAAMTIDPVSGFVSWTPTAVDRGSHSVTVEVTDGRGGRAEQSFVLTVVDAPANRAPAFTTTPPVLATLDTQYVYDADAIDADGDSLTFSLVDGPAGMTVDPATGLVTWTPTAAQLATHSVTLEVSDGNGGTARQSFTLCSIDPASIPADDANTAPVITSTPPLTALTGQPFEYRIFAQDANDDALTFSLNAPPAGATITPITGLQAATFSFTPATVGTQTVEIQVGDGNGGVTIQAFDIQVSDPTGNNAPVISSNPRLTIPIGRTWAYFVDAFDVDNDALVLSLTTSPAAMTLDADARQLLWMPTAADIGTHDVTVSVDDGQGGIVTQSFTLDVVSQEANTAPQIVSTPQTFAVAGTAFEYDLLAFDADNDPVQWSLVQAPAGVSIDPLNGTLRWTPTLNQLGLQQFVVQGTDPSFAAVTQEFTVSVTCLNLPPTIASAPGTAAVTDQRYVYPVRAFDPEGDVLTFSLTTAPAGMQVDPLTGVIRWTPDSTQTGLANVTVVVTDAAGNSATQSFAVNVTQQVVNLDPVITSRPGFRATVDALYEYQVDAEDPEGEVVTFSLLTSPTGMTIDANGLILWTPASTQAGPHIVEVAVDDGQGGRAIQRFAILARINQAPAITSTAPATVSSHATFRYDVVAEDPEGDAVTFSLTTRRPA
ncbi:MAG: putative Ig domain-containing protein [Planctomycetaceae bacterium]